jgi:hypothetical protein
MRFGSVPAMAIALALLPLSAGLPFPAAAQEEPIRIGVI